mmetsp:Transcript_14086/g.33753  ORF Transcript_14086/g.33753 Transcript_14086/m.33753 type:complete len:382 (-) Transcript_14086:110-1255(-)
MHHLDVVQQRRETVQHRLGRPHVHGLQALLQRGEVLDVVLALVRRVRHLHVDRLPVAVRLGPARHGHAQHELALLGLELLGDAVELGHAVAPVLQLRVRPHLVALLAARLALLQQRLRAVAPVLQHRLDVLGHLGLGGGAVERLRAQLDGVHVLLVRLHQVHAALQALHRLRQRGAELGDALHKLCGVLLGVLAPVGLALEDGHVQVGDQGAERVQHAAPHLPRRHVLLHRLVAHPLGVDPDEVDGVVAQSVQLAACDKELLLSAHGDVVPVRGLLLGHLVVEQQLGRPRGLVERLDLGVVRAHGGLALIGFDPEGLSHLGRDEGRARVSHVGKLSHYVFGITGCYLPLGAEQLSFVVSFFTSLQLMKPVVLDARDCGGLF